ncbi:hypothetical protein ACLB2K_006790 [Fragaria x ananassa]
MVGRGGAGREKHVKRTVRLELERRRNSFPQFVVNKDTCLQKMSVMSPIRHHHVDRAEVPRKDKNEAWDILDQQQTQDRSERERASEERWKES